jgi:hypothetical protein
LPAGDAAALFRLSPEEVAEQIRDALKDVDTSEDTP